MKYLFREGGPQIDNFISVDGSGSSSITNGALGSHRYKVKVTGPGGHSWGAFGLANTHHAMARGITHFVDRADKYTLKDRPKTSYNVGRIGGGTSVNSIPFESWMEVDMRSLSPDRLVEIDTLFHQAVRQGVAEENEIRRDGPPMGVVFDMIGERPSGHTDEGEAIVQHAVAVTNMMELKPRLRTSSTDSNIPISKGIPAITIGGGGEGGNAHSLDEWYINTDGHLGIQRAFLIVASVAGLDDSGSQ
jgi:di/tripeptidase